MDASIIIPTYNRADALLRTLEVLAKVDYPNDRWEAIVVDDGSTEDVESAVQNWIAASKVPVRYMRQKNAGPALARNNGALAAKGHALIFIDNDIEVPPHFIQAHVKALADHPNCWILGRITHPPQLRQTPFGRFRDDQWEAFYRENAVKRFAEVDGMSAANVCIPADDFRKLGGFDTEFTIAGCEDLELAMRAQQIGIKVLYDPELVVIHNDWAVSIERFCERQRLYSITDVLLWRRYGQKSNRVALVEQNAPINWHNDRPHQIAKKFVKALLATRLAYNLLLMVANRVERFAPDTGISHRAYNFVIAVAIFRGVREGLERYAAPAQGSQTMSQEGKSRENSSL
jgi:GT2 family glycosyltransferase